MPKRRTKQAKPAESSPIPKKRGRPFGVTKQDDRLDEFTGIPATMVAIKRHLDLTLHEFNDLVELQLFPPGLTLDAARIRYIRHLRGGVGPDGSSAAGKLEGKHERAKLAAAQREKIELSLAQQRGELVQAEDVRQALSAAFAAARTRLLGLPTKLAHEASVMKRATQIEALLKKSLKEILDELVDAAVVDGQGARDRIRRDSDASAAAGPDRQRVG